MYEKRLPKLFNYRTFIVNHQLTGELEDEHTNYLFAEANAMYQLFVDMIPTERSLIFDVRHLIQVNYELGRKQSTEDSKELVNFGENFSFHFFKYGFVTSLLLVILSLVLWIMGKAGLLLFIGLIVLAV